MPRISAGFSSTRCAGWSETKWPIFQHPDRDGTDPVLPHFLEPRAFATRHPPGVPQRRTPGCRLLLSRRMSAIPCAGRTFRPSTRSWCPHATEATARCRPESAHCRSSGTRSGSTLSARANQPFSRDAFRSTTSTVIPSHHRYRMKRLTTLRPGGRCSYWRTITPTTASSVGTGRRPCTPQSLTGAAMRSGREPAISTN